MGQLAPHEVTRMLRLRVVQAQVGGVWRSALCGGPWPGVLDDLGGVGYWARLL